MAAQFTSKIQGLFSEPYGGGHHCKSNKYRYDHMKKNDLGIRLHEYCIQFLDYLRIKNSILYE